MASIPVKCPKCGGGTVLAQISAWGIYTAGVFQTFDTEGEVEPLPSAVAICDNDLCGHEFAAEA